MAGFCHQDSGLAVDRGLGEQFAVTICEVCVSTTSSQQRTKPPVAEPHGAESPGANPKSDETCIQPEIYCPYFHHAVELIGRRWTGVVLLALSRSPMRYSRLREQIPGLSDRLLTERLSELEAEGIVDRTNPVGSPLYGLSSFGRELIPVIEAIQTFAHASALRTGELDRPGRRHDVKSLR